MLPTRPGNQAPAGNTESAARPVDPQLIAARKLLIVKDAVSLMRDGSPAGLPILRAVLGSDPQFGGPPQNAPQPRMRPYDPGLDEPLDEGSDVDDEPFSEIEALTKEAGR